MVMNRRLVFPVLVIACVLAMAGASAAINLRQQQSATRSANLTSQAVQMSGHFFAAHDAMQQYVHGDKTALDRYKESLFSLRADLAAATRLAGGDRQLAAHMTVVSTIVGNWSSIADTGAENGWLQAAQNRELNAFVASFRLADTALVDAIGSERSASLGRAALTSVLLIVVLGLIGIASGASFWRYETRLRKQRDLEKSRERSAQRELTEMLQVTRSEGEAYSLLRRYIERLVPNARAVVLNRNNSKDRLEPRTPLPSGSCLADALMDARPDSCLAVRLARTVEQDPENQTLLECDVCACLGRSTCVPSLVGGEVIGSVLVDHDAPLRDTDAPRIADAVSQAAPVLANLRNLEIAEARALTDGLTGLPNARAFQDTLKQLVAHSIRSEEPLSVTILDLDRFKQLNDTLGHEKGDLALAAVGAAIAGTIRASDFAARYGGEEFVVVMPDTDQDGAVTLANKLRLAIEGLVVIGIDRTLTASFGVASLTVDGGDPDALMRIADRALYAAKAAGRNRVEVPELV
jgi:diguanylate cyclase (GGDEF)-like protein